MAETAATPPDDLAAVFSGSLAHCANTLSLGALGSDFFPATDLLDSEVVARTVDGFGACYAPADRRAIVSFWSLWYFGTLLVPVTAASLLLRRALPVRLDRVGIHLDDERFQPTAVRLPNLGRHEPEASPFELLDELVREHLEPLIRSIARSERLSERLLWSNAGGYIEWTIRQLVDHPGGAEAAALGDELLAAPSWPDGRVNPLYRPIRYVEEDGLPVRRRRICCLRYLVPGVGGCGSICPLPKVRNAG